MEIRTELHFHLRSQELARNDRGWAEWRARTVEKVAPAEKTAIIICDMWDAHWARGAAERVDIMAPRMNEVIRAARDKGVIIVHAPSDVIDFYADHPARANVLSLPQVEPPAELEHAEPPLPVDHSDGGSDTWETSFFKAWTRQHPALEIADEDFISDRGREVYSLFAHLGLEQALLMGVHTGHCILHRTFGIKQLVRWGVNTALVRDLTDALYNPARAPYVSHDEGTQLIIGYIEKFWCPTITSADLV